MLLVRDFVSCLLKRSPAPPSLPERSKRLPIFSCQKKAAVLVTGGLLLQDAVDAFFPLSVAFFFKRRCDARLLLSAALGRDRGGDFSVVLGNFLDPILMAISSFSFDGSAADFVLIQGSVRPRDLAFFHGGRLNRCDLFPLFFAAAAWVSRCISPFLL